MIFSNIEHNVLYSSTNFDLHIQLVGGEIKKISFIHRTDEIVWSKSSLNFIHMGSAEKVNYSR
jgi:hypothetical protein